MASSRQRPWSLGIYTGTSPFSLVPAKRADNPVLAIDDVTDFPAGYLADPFMLEHEGRWNMFFEAKNMETRRGVIGLATSNDGFEWRYQGTVLAEPWHQSYPCVFRWRGDHYMLPEGVDGGPLRLYRAHRFPEDWRCVDSLLDVRCVDATPLYRDGRWWLFACTTPGAHRTLSLFHADRLEGPWTEHPASPLVDDDLRTARPAGRMLELEGRLFRFAQDCRRIYGERVLAHEILELTPTRYREREHAANPVLAPSGKGWNGRAMHHLDPHPLPDGGWIACVDGQLA